MDVPNPATNTGVAPQLTMNENLPPGPLINDGTAGAAAPQPQPQPQPEGRKKNISDAAKKELFEFFSKSNWTLNKNMPKENGNTALDNIIKKHGLNRKQAARQLKNWKNKEFNHSVVTFIIGKEELEKTIYDHISVPLEEYVTSFLEDLYEGNDIAGCLDTTNLIRSLELHLHSDQNRRAIKFLHDNPTHACNKILVELIRNFTTAMATYFPKKASKLPDAEMKFALDIRYSKGDAIKKWMDNCLDSWTLGKEDFGHLGQFVFDCLYAVWCLSSVEDDRPDIEVAATDLVAKYSRPIVYYVAGWTLQRASLALTEAVDERKKYADFAMKHSIGKAAAEASGLPYNVVEMRQKRSLVFCSADYFAFICVIESTYVHNLTLKMMLAYTDGDLVNAIHMTLYKSEKIRSMFFSLAGGARDEDEQASQLDILKFILDRYVRMRGCWFTKFLKSTQGKSLDEQKLESATTTMKIAQAAEKTKVEAKARADAKADIAKSTQPDGDDMTEIINNSQLSEDESGEVVNSIHPDGVERQLWSTVEETVMNYQDEEDDIEDENTALIATEFQYEESDDE